MKDYRVNPTILEHVIEDLKLDSYLDPSMELAGDHVEKPRNGLLYRDDYDLIDALGYYRTDEIIDDICSFLRGYKIIPMDVFPNRLMYRYFWDLVKYNFVVPWKSFTYTMEKLVYVLSCIKKPKKILSIGINCGYTFAFLLAHLYWSKSDADVTVAHGIEKNTRLAQIAKTNLSHLNLGNRINIMDADALFALDAIEDEDFDLVFLDTRSNFQIMEKLYAKMIPGGWLMMHNASDIHFTAMMHPFLEFARDTRNFSDSFLFPIDTKGLELSVKVQEEWSVR